MSKTAWFLLALGLLQMSGDLLEQVGLPVLGRTLKGLGAATTASPAPKVFSAVRGLETYSTQFRIEWSDLAGARHELLLTPEIYSRLRGPYNRRNLYGAALAYGPVLVTNEPTEAMFWSVTKYAFCGDAPLLRELGIDPGDVLGVIRVRYEPAAGTRMGDLPRVLEVTCP